MLLLPSAPLVRGTFEAVVFCCTLAVVEFVGVETVIDLLLAITGDILNFVGREGIGIEASTVGMAADACRVLYFKFGKGVETVTILLGSAAVIGVELVDGSEVVIIGAELVGGVDIVLGEGTTDIPIGPDIGGVTVRLVIGADAVGSVIGADAVDPEGINPIAAIIERGITGADISCKTLISVIGGSGIADTGNCCAEALAADTS